ncbi:MAG: hypothetical protein LBK53_01975 [Heliobacteriaceae bacterium]|nr:hypothetical protein [Heliobacteriaceae bacterium]
MGMSASQARLLSITARLSDNEHVGQNVSYSKQRLADQTDQIQAEYNSALGATKLTVLTGFVGADPQYTDISYNLMTSQEMALNNKQYLITNAKGKILVTKTIADYFNYAAGDYNKFLAKLGYSQSDINFKDNDGVKSQEEKNAAVQKIHDAWDKYFVSVGEGIGHDEHLYAFSTGSGLIGWEQFTDSNGNQNILDGFVVIKYTNDSGQNINYPVPFDGTTKEQRELYDYAVAITEAYCVNGLSNKPRTGADLSTAASPENKSALTYYQNLYNEMLANGFYTYGAPPNDFPPGVTIPDDMYLPYSVIGGNSIPNKAYGSPLDDNNIFEQMIRKGELQIKFYSLAERKFVSTTIDQDQAIQDVKDERKIALAESKYKLQMTDLERKDKRLDLELKKLDTEHNTLQTEYDSVKSVIDKNVEKTFSIFS